jgi:hypothetical protein
MTKILLAGIAALSVLSASAAHTVTLPKEMLGDWCYDEAHQEYRHAKCEDDSFVRVIKDGLITVEARCKFDKIEQAPTRNIFVYLVHSICTGVGEPYTENLEFRLTNEGLTIRPVEEPSVEQKPPPTGSYGLPNSPEGGRNMEGLVQEE